MANEASAATGVDKYLAKKEQTVNEIAGKTGVERYLAKQASHGNGTVEALTGVAKYVREHA